MGGKEKGKIRALSSDELEDEKDEWEWLLEVDVLGWCEGMLGILLRR